MKYWDELIDFIFYLLHFLKLGIVHLYKVLKALWWPIYLHVYPTACQIIDWTNGKKTYIVSGAGIIGIIMEYHRGSIALSQVIVNAPILVTAMTIRHGMARNAATATNEIANMDTCLSGSSSSSGFSQSSSSSSSSSSQVARQSNFAVI